MGNGNAWIFIVVVLVVAAAITAVVTYFLTRSWLRNFARNNRNGQIILLPWQMNAPRQLNWKGATKALKVLEEAETDIGRRRSELGREEERLQKRRAELDHRVERLELREQTLNKRQSALDKRTNEVEKMASQHLAELQRIAQLSVEEARALLLAEAETEARNDMARIIRQVETEARTEGEKRARSIISDAIQRVASDHVAAVSTSVVTLPNEEMKGRIVGRNGRNIRAFEQAAGVDVIVDDTPEAVTISCFDPIAGNARRTLDRLIVDGRIHPAPLKNLAEEQRDVEKDIIQAGEQAVYEAGVGALHPEISRMLGRLKYRTSYGQNQLAHAVEVAKLAALIAADLGADVEVARQAGFASRSWQGDGS